MPLLALYKSYFVILELDIYVFQQLMSNPSLNTIKMQTKIQLQLLVLTVLRVRLVTMLISPVHYET